MFTLLHMVVVHSFSLLGNILLFEYTTIYLNYLNIYYVNSSIFNSSSVEHMDGF